MEQNVWKRMYLEIAKSVTDVIELLPKTRENDAVRNILIRAMQNAEDIYIQEPEPAEEPEKLEETS